MPKSWKDQGGAAFPIQASDWSRAEDGMSLRDYFAGQALVGLISMARHERVQSGAGIHIVEQAYQFADAMLAERNG